MKVQCLKNGYINFNTNFKKKKKLNGYVWCIFLHQFFFYKIVFQITVL